ncbi:spore-associated protein A [Actinorugispora endophytica]|uniref:spore-associated protein A n=1 Tax=Actinorugispora endophytica TaxID=1605990 RepID=UPI001060E566|nr:spore-associated protein A [Actinorugispora endophytica]
MLKKAAAAALVAGTVVAGGVATAAPASAATYGGECGSGYSVVNSKSIGSSGTVFLTYNSSNGYNCAVAKRNTAGSAILIEVGLSISPKGNHWDAYEGDYFTSYAGPVYLSAAGSCVDWAGRFNGGTWYGKDGTNCG